MADMCILVEAHKQMVEEPDEWRVQAKSWRNKAERKRHKEGTQKHFKCWSERRTADQNIDDDTEKKLTKKQYKKTRKEFGRARTWGVECGSWFDLVLLL